MAVDEPAGRCSPDPKPLTVGGLPGARLRRVSEYVDLNLHRNVPLAELSAVAHMSRYHFARLFRQSTGESPHRFVLRRRIDRAKLLLADGARSIEVVAAAVGFRSANHFTTTFRRMVGVTPSAYRRVCGRSPHGVTNGMFDGAARLSSPLSHHGSARDTRTTARP
jgi:AraC-like DNA-binding protein